MGKRNAASKGKARTGVGPGEASPTVTYASVVSGKPQNSTLEPHTATAKSGVKGQTVAQVYGKTSAEGLAQPSQGGLAVTTATNSAASTAPLAPTAPPVESRTYRVLLGRRADVDAFLARLAKRCARKGLSPVAWTWGQAATKREHVRQDYACAGYAACNGGVRVSRVPLTLTGEAPRLAGWRFVAALTHLDGENVARTLPGETLPAVYRTRGPKCDHCKVNRRRDDTFVVGHADGRFVQVGSTCLAGLPGSD